MNEAQRIMALVQRDLQKLRERFEGRIEALETQVQDLEAELARRKGGRPRKQVPVEIHEDGPVV